MLIDGRLQQDGELVAAEPGDHVAISDAQGEAPSDLGQQGVAGVVAEAVVDRLEVVQVDEQHGDPVATLPLEGGCGALAEQHPVGQAGEVVVDGFVAQLLLPALQRPHQPEHAGQDEDEEQGGRRRGDQAVGFVAPEEVDGRHAEGGRAHDDELAAGEPPGTVEVGPRRRPDRRVEGGEGEQDVEAEPERIDEQPGVERAVHVVDPVHRVGERQGDDGERQEGERRVFEVHGDDEAGGDRQHRDVHDRVGHGRDAARDRQRRVGQDAVHEEHPGRAEHGRGHDGGVDDAGGVPLCGHRPNQARQAEDHQRVHGEIERGPRSTGTVGCRR